MRDTSNCSAKTAGYVSVLRIGRRGADIHAIYVPLTAAKASRDAAQILESETYRL